MDFLLIAFLTLLNGVFAMSEMALASSRKARLTAMGESGDKGAQAALGRRVENVGTTVEGRVVSHEGYSRNQARTLTMRWMRLNREHEKGRGQKSAACGSSSLKRAIALRAA
jgi:hypothetical protein